MTTNTFCYPGGRVGAFGAIILALLFGFSGFGRAATFLNDNFNNYISGERLSGQDGYFVELPATTTIWNVFNDAVDYMLPRNGSGNFNKIFDDTFTSSTIYVKFKFDGSEYFGRNSIFAVQFFNASDTVYCGADSGFINTTNPYSFSLNEWHILALEMYLDEDNRPHDRIKIDSGAWTAWNDRICAVENGFFNLLRIGAVDFTMTGKISIDNIANDLNLITGYEATIAPESPENCKYNVVDFNNLTISGSIDVPLENPNTYDTLTTRFQVATATIEMYDVQLDLGELTAGETFDYFATFTLPTSTYRVSYILSGTEPIEGKAITDYSYCAGTFVGTGTIPKEIISELTTFPSASYDTCSGLSGTEKWLCEIKNLISGAILPSPEKITELQINVDLIFQKFPFNYLKEIKNFFIDLTTLSGGERPELTISFLGVAGAVDLSMLQKEFIFRGATISILSLIRSVLTILFLLAWIFWAINFAQRIF
jgi:hypothetical protein